LLISHQPWYYFKLGLHSLGWLHLLTILALLLVPWTNATGKDRMARIMLFLLVDVNVVFIDMINGLGGGDELALLVSIPAIFMFFDIRTEPRLLWAMVFAAFCSFGLIYFLDQGVFEWQQLSDEISKEAYIVNFLTTAILLIAVALYFMRLSYREVDDISFRARKQLQTALDHAQDAIFLIDPEQLTIIQCNAQAVERFGVEDKADLEGKSVELLAWDTRGESELREIQAFIREGISRQEREQAYVSLKGEHFWGRTAYSMFDYEGKELLFLRITDITASKEAHLALLAAKEQAEAANRAKTNFLNNMSHEFRTPINGMLHLSQEIRDSVEDEDLQEFANMLYDSSARLHRTLSLVLDVVRLESGDLPTVPQTFSLGDLLRDIMGHFTAEAEKKGLICEVEIGSEGREVRQLQDLARLTITHMLSNAIKFTPSGGAVMVNVTYLDPAEDMPSMARVTIRDTGVGMSQDFMEQHLFSHFIQESEGLNRRFEGTGLGMAIVQKCVELMRGRITVRSEKGKGTEFRLIFPVEWDRVGAENLAQASY